MYALTALARLARPLFLLFAALMYTLGASIARYLGMPTESNAFFLGLVGVLLAQSSMSLLAAVYGDASQPLLEIESQAQRTLVRNAALYASIAALAAAVFVGFVIHTTGVLSAPALLGLGFALLVVLLYAVPPARGVERGFGELLLAVQMAYLAPSLGFLLQAGSYHPLLNVCSAALTLLLAATLVVLEFPSYADDMKHGRSTLLTRMGWKNALRVHHGLVVAAYLVLALAGLLGFSFGLLAPAFLTIPFAVLQAYLLRSIAKGAKPIWNLMKVNSIAVFGLTAYFLTLNFWLR